MQRDKTNPFISSKTAEAYADADPVYVQSTEAVLSVYAPEGKDIADLGSGTGVSSQIILSKLEPGSTLTLIEPSLAMLSEAKQKLGSSVQCLNLNAEQLPEASFDSIYALNCFHLFPDHSKAAQSIHKSLKEQGSFIFNLSSPSYRFTELSNAELDVLYANLDFYAELNLRTQSQFDVLRSTVQLLTSLVTAISFQGREDEIIEGLGISATELISRSRGTARGLYSHTELENIFKAAKLSMEGYTEVLIEVPAEYQRNIWTMMAKAFIQNEAEITEIIEKIEVPKTVSIRQAIFKLCKY